MKKFTLEKFLFVPLFLIVLVMLFAVQGCRKDKVIEPIPENTHGESGVSVDLTKVPYQKLSEYGFFTLPMKNQIPVEGVIPYEPASSLFTDYALKNRFLWMPEGVKASYNGDHEILEFPIGAVLIKNFYYVEKKGNYGSTKFYFRYAY